MGKPYRNILVPYDGSKYSQKALKCAVEIAKAFDSSVHLVNVIDVSAVSPPGKVFSKGTQKSLRQIKTSVKTSVELHLKEIQENYESSGITMKTSVLDGEITEILLKFIHDHNIDLVIIGSKGLSGLSKIVTLGSVSRKISELSNCPVVIVR